MNLRTGAATAIGVPRDSWVPIPGYGSNKINAALYFGGPQALGAAVGDLVGIQPDYVFVSRFKFFQALIGSIGGIDIQNPVAFGDPYLKPEGFAQGRLHLGPYDAMVFSRIRHNLIRGDFDRSANQQRCCAASRPRSARALRQAGFLEGGVMHVMQYLHTDLPPTRLFQLAQAVAPGRPLEDHLLRRPGRHRQHRRRQRGAAVHRPGRRLGDRAGMTPPSKVLLVALGFGVTRSSHLDHRKVSLVVRGPPGLSLETTSPVRHFLRHPVLEGTGLVHGVVWGSARRAEEAVSDESQYRSSPGSDGAITGWPVSSLWAVAYCMSEGVAAADVPA